MNNVKIKDLNCLIADSEARVEALEEVLKDCKELGKEYAFCLVVGKLDGEKKFLETLKKAKELGDDNEAFKIH